MKAIRIFTRGIRDALKSVFRNFSLSTAAITCSSITLVLVAVALVISYNVKNVTLDLEKELTIVTYIKADRTEEQIEELKRDLNNMVNVEKYEYKSKDDWKLEMKSYSDTFNNALDYLDTNPLLDSFTVTVKDVKFLKETTEELKKYEFVESADYGEGMAETLVMCFDVIERITIIIVLALVLVTAFLIGNTIKLTIFSRRNEIEIMRLVGTSNITIRLPFLFEGLILGILGSIIPILVSVYGYVLMYDHFNGYIFTPIIHLVKPFNFILYVAVCLLIMGGVIGMLGSYRAVRKYLKI